LAAAESVDIVATSIADFDVTIGAGATAALDLQSVALTDADMTVGASSTLVLGTSLGVAGSASNIKVSGRGDLDDTDDTTIGDEFNILGTTVTFDMSGLTVDADNMTITTGATVKATLKTGLGDDTITGSALGDSISSGAGPDTITGGAGSDTINGGTGVDVALYSDVTLATSHSLANLTGVAVNLSAAAITAATLNTAMGTVIGGGAGVAGADLAAGSAGYLTTNAGTSTVTMVRDSLSGVESITGSALADYIVGGTTGGVFVGGAGADSISGGAGADTITGGVGVDSMTGGAAIDLFVLDGGLSIDVVTDFATGVDVIQIDTSAFEIAGAVVAAVTLDMTTGTGTALATGTAAQQAIAGATIIAAGTATEMFNYTASTPANAAALEIALEAGGGLLTTDGTTTLATNDAMPIMYDNGTNIMLAIFRVEAGVGTGIQLANVDVIDILSLTGITTDLATADIVYI
jgi:Ca2+-binding RTX toxin-like protein